MQIECGINTKYKEVEFTFIFNKSEIFYVSKNKEILETIVDKNEELSALEIIRAVESIVLNLEEEVKVQEEERKTGSNIIDFNKRRD